MSASTAAATTGGGAWEAILEKASTAVTEYLAATTRDFDPAAPLSQHMLHLIDRGTLRDIVVERNYNELCARLGCRNKPRGLVQANEGSGAALCFDWESSDSASSSCSDADDDAAGGQDKKQPGTRDADPHDVPSRASSGERGSARAAGAGVASRDKDDVEDAEEIVYEDDLYTAESFRLAQRQRALLNRMQRKKLRREQRAMRAAAAATGPPAAGRPALVGPGGAAPAGPRVLRNGMLGARFPQRFCCAECEELHASAIVPCVLPFATHDYPTVFGAVTNLFPNLRVATLQQLAGAETSAAGLVKPVVETQSRPGTDASAAAEAALRPVQVGLSYESSAHLPRSRADKVKAGAVVSTGGGDGAATASTPWTTPVLLREVLEQMHVLQHVWNHEVVPRFSESHLPRVAVPQDAGERAEAAGARAGGAAHSAVAASARALTHAGAPVPPPSQPRPALRGSLLLFDFIMNTSSATTRRVFRVHFTQHRAALLKRCGAAPATGAASGTGSGMGSGQSLANGSLFCRVSHSIVTALEARRAASADRDGQGAGEDGGGDDLRVDPVLQQQRRELFVSHFFSDEVTATLSRLLLVDYGVLSNGAWSGVWFKDVPLPAHAGSASSAGSAHTSVSLLRSLRFPFAVPAVLLQAAGSTPEVLGLAMVLLIAAGCCSDVVWRGCAQAEVAFEEVAEAVGLTDEDVAAAVRSLMLGEEE